MQNDPTIDAMVDKVYAKAVAQEQREGGTRGGMEAISVNGQHPVPASRESAAPSPAATECRVDIHSLERQVFGPAAWESHVLQTAWECTVLACSQIEVVPNVRTAIALLQRVLVERGEQI